MSTYVLLFSLGNGKLLQKLQRRVLEFIAYYFNGKNSIHVHFPNVPLRNS